LTAGHILESAIGTAEASAHDLLLRKNGAYRKLVDAQAFKAERADAETVIEGNRTPTHPASNFGDEIKDEKPRSDVLEQQQSGETQSRDVEEGVVTQRKQSLFHLVARMLRLNGRWMEYLAMLITAGGSGCVYPCFGILFGGVVRLLSFVTFLLSLLTFLAFQIGAFSSPDRDIIRSQGNRYALYCFVIALRAFRFFPVHRLCVSLTLAPIQSLPPVPSPSLGSA
jgi:ATP-binding cassette subfamily B (MDR/TAP) protein 1